MKLLKPRIPLRGNLKTKVSDDFSNGTTASLNNTQAFIGDKAKVNAGGSIRVKAGDKTVVIIASGAGSGGGAAG